MKKNLILLILSLTVSLGFSQENESKWNVQPEHELTINYNLLGRSYAQGMFYGAGGYGLGMWLSGNRTHWGIIGSILSVNIPLILEKRLDEPETLIGRNLGALTTSIGATVTIKLHRKGKATWNIAPWLRTE